MSRLDGRIAIVTGGASGQGASHARHIVAEGGRVVIGDVLADAGRALAAELGEDCLFQQLDVSRQAEWEALLAATKDRFGLPTILVNNAGLSRHSTIVDQSLEEFSYVLNVNLVGAWLGIKVVAPAMIEARSGSIINISSVSGLQGFTKSGAYCSSKWGIRGLTRVAALELGHHGIRVNDIVPGPIDTPWTASVDHSTQWASHPIPRVGVVDEISKLVVFLASDDSSFSTGADFVADGGMAAGTAMPLKRDG